MDSLQIMYSHVCTNFIINNHSNRHSHYSIPTPVDYRFSTVMVIILFQIVVKLHRYWVHAGTVCINGTITAAWAIVLLLCMGAAPHLMLIINLTQRWSVCTTVGVETVSIFLLFLG